MGTKIIEQLVNIRGISADSIATLVRNPYKATHLIEMRIKLREGSYENVEQMVAAFLGVKKLLIISSPDIENMKRLQKQLNAVNAAEKVQVKHIHLVSLAEAEDRIFGLEDVDTATEYMVLATNIPFRNNLKMRLLNPLF